MDLPFFQITTTNWRRNELRETQVVSFYLLMRSFPNSLSFWICVLHKAHLRNRAVAYRTHGAAQQIKTRHRSFAVNP